MNKDIDTFKGHGQCSIEEGVWLESFPDLHHLSYGRGLKDFLV